MSAKVFAVQAGARIAVDHYGDATVDQYCVVPDEVAAELDGRQDLRIERETPTVIARSPRSEKAAAVAAEEKK